MGRFLRPDWYDDAPCRGSASLFFADNDDHAQAALATCQGCEHRAECLELALKMPVSQDHGIWGGTTARMRRTIRKRRREERRLSA
jgi:hypothetical protein